MLERDVLTHHSQIAEIDQNFILDNYEDLMHQASELRNTFDALERINRLNFSMELLPVETPRISLGLLRYSFTDLQDYNEKTKVLDFIGSVALPQTDATTEGEPREATLAECRVESCDEAEGFFVDALNQVIDGAYRGQPNISVYHDADGNPLAFRKSEEASSALTLEPVKIQDVVLPAGTIVGVHRRMNKYQTGECDRDRKQLLRTFLIENGDDLSIAPARFSPWAYDKAIDRSLFAIGVRQSGDLRYYKKRAGVVVHHTIDDFRIAANHVMSLV